jgi:hypothetical protein
MAPGVGPGGLEPGSTSHFLPLGSVRLLWLPVLALSLGFLALDTGHRLRTIGALTTLVSGQVPGPIPDPASPSGFKAGQHRLILPTAGADGYHWILLTERMLAGEGLRVRSTQVDNAPHGREVHWSSLPRWWLGTLAWARSAWNPELTLPRALEQVAAGGGALALGVLLLVLTPGLAWRFGGIAASIFAAAWVAVFPLYETFMAGMVDHHGFVAMAAFLGVIFLAAGGAGWVREGAAGAAVRHPLPIPERATARRWFVAAGVAGGVGLWISAATMIPVIAATAAGGVLSLWVAGRSGEGAGAEEMERVGAGDEMDPGEAEDQAEAGEGLNEGGARAAPGLWRAWGAAGCATALAAYLVEYAPGHMGLRLEVNHPLYALAWLGAGDLMARVGGVLSGGSSRPRGEAHNRGWWWVGAGGSLALLLAPAVLVLAGGGAVFLLSDPFLRGLHLEHIREFQGLAHHLGDLSGLHALQSVSALPLLLLPAAALVAPSRCRSRSDLARWVLAGGMVLGGAVLFHLLAVPWVQGALVGVVLQSAGPGGGGLLTHLAVGALDLAAVGLLFLLPLRSWSRATTPERSRLEVAAVPALSILALSFWQVRWLPTASAALLALGVVVAGLLMGRPRPGSRAWSVPGACLWVLILLPFPLFTLLFPWRFGYSASEEAMQVVARDVAHGLRARGGDGDLVVAAPPVTTTWLIYFGGVRGLGTLYWENLEGLRATASLASASHEGEAREILARHGATHLLLPSWEAFRYPDGAGKGGEDAGGKDSLGTAPEDAFLARLLSGDPPPGWLMAVPYEVPALAPLEGMRALLFEIRSAEAEGGG